MNRNWAVFFAILAVLSIRDAFISGESKHDSSAEEFAEFDDEPPLHKYTKAGNEGFGDGEEEVEIRDPSGDDHGKAFNVPLNAPPIRFSYCISCGYRQAYDQFSQLLSEKFPGVTIEGANYPPSALKAMVAQVFGLGKIAIIMMIIFNRNPFEQMGRPTPSIVNWMFSNKVSACLMVFLFSNSIESMMMSSGAFEIYVGEELIWSKLESGRVPTPAELIQAIESQFELQGAKTGSDAFGMET